MYYLLNLNLIKFENHWKNGKNTGKVREFCQSGKVGTLSNLYYTCILIPQSRMGTFHEYSYPGGGVLCAVHSHQDYIVAG